MVKPTAKPPALYCDLISTAWGPIAAIWSDVGLWELGFPCADETAALAGIRVKEFTMLEAGREACLWSEELSRELQVYFQGFPVTFSVPVDWRLYTPFQTAVLTYTAGIPYGTTVSYQTVAQAIGNPKATRAVGGALNGNRTPLVVPCHRVVGANGSLTGFEGGIDLKRALLLLETEIVE
ncbi:Methylated-DNA/protein-cysteine methyltransferase [uncultured Sporomusa sp.]|uniref:methylated-DNA--[protein]-cysteine S-methyltransferase n=1 Tax=uncultured Sporomusa sp. TaxID=307249 RepID=A0A212LLT1_9FIRM|nr:methylated-DNA--[protein]-cysteine S-methyltransferase [uncultured Sporomusa sp.]SCM78492.1 Methylated-DNA/protein-cysteine methyltransferase [uncultured Sporomusa sp.]